MQIKLSTSLALVTSQIFQQLSNRWLSDSGCSMDDRHYDGQVYATSMAMLVTMIVSIFAFGLTPTLQLMLGMSTASISLALYYLNPAMLIEPQASEADKAAIPSTDV